MRWRNTRPRRRGPVRFRRRGLIRPTLPCLLLVAVGAVVCYMGLLLDERTLMAATVALAAMIVVSFATLLLQWFRGVPATERTMTPQYERLDQHGAVVDRIVGDPPDRRGLYRLHGVVVGWRSPFGLFAASRVEDRPGETLVLPEGDDRASVDAARAAGKRVAGTAQAEQMGSVRGYAPGDPIKLISWKHTARRGTLMTRETGRDERAVLVLALNSRCGDGADGGRMDRQVATILPFLDAVGHGEAGPRVVVTDGVSFHEGGSSARRFLAAVRDDGASAADGDVPSDAARAAAVSRFVRGRSGPVAVLVCDAGGSRGFRRALEASPASGHLRVLTPTRRAPERYVRTTVASPGTSASAGGAPAPGAVPNRGSGTSTRSDRARPRIRVAAASPVMLPAAVSSASLLVMFGVALKGLGGLVSTNGAWMWFAAALLGVAVIESNVPWRDLVRRGTSPERGSTGGTGRRMPRIRLALVRVGAYALLTVLATAILLVVRLRDLTGGWLFSRDQRGGAWNIVRFAVTGGFDSLNLQLPPLKVTVTGDVFLILVVAAAAIVIRCLLIARAAGPGMAILAVAALAADYSIVGHTAPWWAIIALAVAFPMGVWAVRPRRLRPPAALVAALVVAAVTVAGTPSAETLAYNVPLSIGEGGGMFSSNTVSPMIDLKRNIANGSDTVVLDYRSYRRMYLRMTTLDQFDGDTWGYDKSLALDAGLYGAGIQLGRNASDELSESQRRIDNPLSAYMRMLGYYGYDVANVNQNTLEQYMGYAKVRIATLKSRFLPMPGIYTDANGVGSDWLSYRDGSIYNRSGSTSEDTSYTASGVYLDPITSSSGFSELTAIENTIADLKQQNGVSETQLEQWLKEREALAVSGLGQIVDDTVYIHATVGSDGEVTGPDGWALGKVSMYRMDLSDPSSPAIQDNGMVLGGGSTSASGPVPSEITFNSTVTEQLGAGKDAVVYGFSSDGTSAVIAMPLVDVTSAAGREWKGSDGSTYTSIDGVSAWISMAGNALVSTMGMAGFQGASSSDAGANSMLDWITSAVKASDRRAHASRYTALPKTLPANVKAVIKQAQSAGVPIKGSGYDDQVRVMRWLVDYFTSKGNGFTYSFDAPDGDGRSNMEVINDFLDPDTGHAGYCQHYASALAVLARAMGVSTRIVLGYNAGADDDRTSDGYRSVRSRQLHAWVEAYLDGVGWVPFDVTPASEENGTLGDETASSSTSSSSSSDSSSATDTQSAQGQTTDSPSSSDSSSDAADARTDDAKTKTSSRTGKAGSSAADASVWGAAAAWFAALPVWGRAVVCAGGGLLLVALLVFAPRGVRWWRRRRCIGVAQASAAAPDDVGLRARAWRLAWEQIRREGRRRGVRWSDADTDAAIAARIVDSYAAATGAGGKKSGADTPKAIARVLRNASAAAFGGVPEPVGRLPHELRRLFRAPRHAGGR
ncbi:DUF58 domain-containing protein [Bifidobacterium sp. MA2]|uniref:DUF58 domain-containing protein n=1 Tax=Bifidobacterium santillanense TaxID=2809028 RepID=A0ABS5URT2_9BIFI|nr:transglutaminaseTgpA domain-containing protein [Bifidobacterium santillanense]MBT1173700.1 DUF58 domain-containing protein [Bifidobacterium santillanense]